MEALELELKHVKVLLKKAYEWRAKINKRQNRGSYFKTQKAIRRLKRFIKNPIDVFIPNKNEILLTISWFLRCPPHNMKESSVFTLVSLVYKLHRSKLDNLKSTTI